MYHNGNDCTISAVTTVIIMIFVILMMIRMQRMEVEMMVMIKDMRACQYDDSAQIYRLEKSTW